MKTTGCYYSGKELFSSSGRVDGLDSKSYVPAFSSSSHSLPWLLLCLFSLYGGGVQGFVFVWFLINGGFGNTCAIWFVVSISISLRVGPIWIQTTDLIGRTWKRDSDLHCLNIFLGGTQSVSLPLAICQWYYKEEYSFWSLYWMGGTKKPMVVIMQQLVLATIGP